MIKLLSTESYLQKHVDFIKNNKKKTILRPHSFKLNFGRLVIDWKMGGGFREQNRLPISAWKFFDIPKYQRRGL